MLSKSTSPSLVGLVALASAFALAAYGCGEQASPSSRSEVRLSPVPLQMQGYEALETEHIYGDSLVPLGLAAVLNVDGSLPVATLGSRSLAGLADTLALREGYDDLFLTLYIDFGYDREIAKGARDSQLVALAQHLTRLTDGGRQVHLAIGHTVDSPGWAYGVSDFGEVYGHVRGVLEARGATAVRYGVYLSGGRSDEGQRPELAFLAAAGTYDWIGTTVVHIDDGGFERNIYLGASSLPVLDSVAEARGIPLAVLDSHADALVIDENPDGPDLWQRWYVPFDRTLARYPRIGYYAHRGRWMSDSTIARRWGDYVRESRHQRSRPVP